MIQPTKQVEAMDVDISKKRSSEHGGEAGRRVMAREEEEEELSSSSPSVPSSFTLSANTSISGPSNKPSTTTNSDSPDSIKGLLTSCSTSKSTYDVSVKPHKISYPVSTFISTNLFTESSSLSAGKSMSNNDVDKDKEIADLKELIKTQKNALAFLSRSFANAPHPGIYVYIYPKP